MICIDPLDAVLLAFFASAIKYKVHFQSPLFHFLCSRFEVPTQWNKPNQQPKKSRSHLLTSIFIEQLKIFLCVLARTLHRHIAHVNAESVF